MNDLPDLRMLSRSFRQALSAFLEAVGRRDRPTETSLHQEVVIDKGLFEKERRRRERKGEREREGGEKGGGDRAGSRGREKGEKEGGEGGGGGRERGGEGGGAAPKQPLTRKRRSGNERGLRYGRRELSDPLVQQLNAAASAPDLASVGIAQYYRVLVASFADICARKHTGAKTDRCGINCECTDCVVHLVNQRETLGSDLVRNRRLRERSCRQCNA